jgi:glycosyltransferase involved in cell wall biosynthesis
VTGKPDTLIILTPGFPKDESDSTCLPLQQALVKELHKNNPSLRLIILSFQYPFEKKQYQWHGITVISAGGKNKGGIQRRFTWRRIKQSLEKIHTTQHIKGILSFWCGETALIGHRFAAKHRLKHFCWICGQDAKAENKLVKKINPSSDELVALSDFIRDEFEKNHGVRPAHLIPPGVKPELFTQAGDTKVIDLLAAGSLIPLKQFGIFIELVAAILPRFPGIKAAICGEGSERKKLEKQIASSGLSNNILLTGELAHNDLLKLMQRTRLFIHPSSYEGFGLVNLEALYAGAQVISFVQPMQKEIPNWHIVKDREEMKDKITTLLEAAPVAIAGAPDFSIEKTARAFIDLLEITNPEAN